MPEQKNLNVAPYFDDFDEEEFVEIVIQLWDRNIGRDTLCDIAYNDNSNPDRKELTLFYSLRQEIGPH